MRTHPLPDLDEGVAAATPVVAAPADFDEATYLRQNPDVAGAVGDGTYASGRDHYVRYGLLEGRRYRPEPAEAVTQDVVEVLATSREIGVPPMPAFRIEAVWLSPGGGAFVTGWIDDAVDRLAALDLTGEGWTCDLVATSLVRTRRRDVEAALGGGRHAYGLWSFVDIGRPLQRHIACRLRLGLRSGAAVTLDARVRDMTDAALRDLVLETLAGSDVFGSPYTAAVAGLAGGAGAQIVAHSRRLTADLVARPYVERFGPVGGRAKASLVVCLFGRPDYLFVQNALFAGLPGFDDHEFIFVCNSPELGERLAADARIAAIVHGTRQTLILLPGNAGFAAANNVGVAHAASDRVVALNPDTAPRQPDWARRHARAVDGLPAEQTALFGVPLFYEDGSLMHAGMFFEMDTVPVEHADGIAGHALLRVEHYGKGMPAPAALRSRPVPAVTGAFLSCRRAWFERLGGFSEDYVFGHYEDADLCLRSLAAGTAPWLHDIRLWHLEGKGGTRARAQEGASFVNRWLFSDRWAAMARDGLLGPEPAHPRLSGERARQAGRRR